MRRRHTQGAKLPLLRIAQGSHLREATHATGLGALPPGRPRPGEFSGPIHHHPGHSPRGPLKPCRWPPARPIVATMLIYSRFIHLLSSARDNLASEFLDPCGGTLALRYYVFTALMIPNLEVVDSRHVGPSNHFAVARQVAS